MKQKGGKREGAGRPKGSRNQSTLYLQSLLDGEAEAITRKAIELAKNGEMQAIKLVLERIMPTAKDTPIRFTIPPLHHPHDVMSAHAHLIAAVAAGELTPQEGKSFADLLEGYRKHYETLELEQRITALEERR
ncbi:MAG: hypothetical protein EAZ52_05305 [Alphaproteobacteria bacterium]|nr:MAG: hypothetical protein EAZ52_05305 [Alphaproteobacteria bacterium]